MYSIIPKKFSNDNQNNFKLKGNNTQKLTLKKVARTRKTDQANSQIGSARAVSHSINQHSSQQTYSNLGVMSECYNNPPNDNMMDQLQNMENQIQQNQIRLRNELAQMQSNYNQQTSNQKMRQLNNNSQDIDDRNIDISNEYLKELQELHHDESKTNNFNYAPQINVLQQNMIAAGQPFKLNPNQVQLNNFATQAIPASIKNSKMANKPPNSANFQMKGIPPQPKPNRSTGNSVQGKQIKNPKVNIEDINIEIDGFSQLSQQQHLVEQTQALNYISTKKSVSTKNQVKTKNQTQNVQNLLREAKREMIIDTNAFDNIPIGGDDISQPKQ